MEWNSKKIKAFRKKLGLSQTKFAELLGASHALISYWETGKRTLSKVSQLALTYLAEREGVDLEELEKKDIEDIEPKYPKEEKEFSQDVIKAFREKLGLNQTEFAEKLSRDLSTVSKWESEKRHPGKESIRRIKKLAEKEGIELDLSSGSAQAGRIPESEVR